MNITVQIISATTVPVASIKRKYTVIGEYVDGVDGLKIAEKYKPIIILLDHEVEQENTDIYINTLLIESPKSKVIMLGKNLSDEIVLSSLIHGCFGYLDWDDVDEFLEKALQFVGQGEAWVSRRLVGLLLEKIRD